MGVGKAYVYSLYEKRFNSICFSFLLLFFSRGIIIMLLVLKKWCYFNCDLYGLFCNLQGHAGILKMTWNVQENTTLLICWELWRNHFKSVFNITQIYYPFHIKNNATILTVYHPNEQQGILFIRLRDACEWGYYWQKCTDTNSVILALWHPIFPLICPICRHVWIALEREPN